MNSKITAFKQCQKALKTVAVAIDYIEYCSIGTNHQDPTMESVIQSLLGFADLFLSGLGLMIAAAMAILVVAISWMYFSDISQTHHAIRRNYPVIGRFRYFFEHLGEFFRQYFFCTGSRRVTL